ncbi:MAG: two-component sensor histidine kinase [Hyphomicrobiales bacterium]|nr:two-component sensor histidine kinase [Hyphomicrobiales bacterium]
MSEVAAENRERSRGSDLRVLAQRQRVASQVRETRDKLTSAVSGTRTFDVQLVRLFAEGRVNASLYLLALACAVGAVARLWLSAKHVSIWLCLLAFSLAVSWALARQVLRLPESKLNPTVWKRLFQIAETIQGVVWTTLIALLLNVPDENARDFVFFVLMLISAVNTLSGAALPSVIYGALLPVAGAVAIIAQMGLSFVPLALMALAAQGYFVVLSRRFYAAHVASLHLRREKDQLIGELEHAKRASDEARERAEEASLAKSRFLATMSHELRTPLNAILGFSEVMKGELFGAHVVPAYKDYSADIHASGQHLLQLINEILDLSRVEAGRYELKEDAISLPFIVEDCRRLLGLRADKRGIVMTEAIESDLPRLWADERAVRQVALNLLTNAIKFTPPGGSIIIKVGWTSAGGQYLAIRDTGTGIPAEEIPIVMSSFGRGSSAQKNADEGSGLGLPIVKGLIELHGGAFTLKSEVRVGTEVIVVFPPSRVMDALPQLVTRRASDDPDEAAEDPASGQRAA